MVIVIVSPAYPHPYNPAEYSFVKELVDAIALQGHECHVVAPYSILHYKKKIKKYYSYSVSEMEVQCYRPYYCSFSDRFAILYKLGVLMLNCAAYKAMKRIPQKPDVIYGHFWRGAYMGYKYAAEKHIPLFVATGESVIEFERTSQTSAFCNYVSGVICVSTKNKLESINKGLTVKNKCVIIPNAVNPKLFHRIDKKVCRNKLGFSCDDFIIIFVGNFGERKGVLRVAEALNGIPGVKSLFVGQGPQNPICDGILYKGPVKHEMLPFYLSASDVFVLPTLHEGCCNAIVEAMACGLPIISSDLPFNYDILDTTNSILISPYDIDAIKSAISMLMCDERKKTTLAQNSIAKAKRLDITERSKRIIEFMRNNMM